ncbi:MAG: hypothetical protein IIA07_11195 [Proteobacteria bacterium]|nr:hypothetical protein [Pseudomonadota bacterium]
MSLFQELKRRNVIRVALLYLIASWLLLQLADVLSSILPVPDWTGSFVFMMLLICLAPVLIFSWIYEMTPEGLKREKDIDRSTSITSNTGKKINGAIIVLLILAIGSLIADRLMPEAAAPVTANVTAEPVHKIAGNTIAVLPFTDLSAEGDQQFFTDGLSDELLNLLVRVDGLKVTSRTSSFAFRGSSLGIPEISKTLGVAHVLEGSVRKSGNRIRITAQLIEADTDKHLWSENFDRELDDIFAIQDEIGNAIVNALKGAMGIAEPVAIKVVAATDNVDAYALYLQARELFIKRQNLPESIRLFHQAIALDPDFARAWEGLAAVEIVADDWVFGDGVSHAPLALEAANNALALDSDLSMPFAVIGSHAGNWESNPIEAMRNYDIALQKDPKNTTAMLWRGIELNFLGYFDDAIRSFEHCLEVDPGYLNCKHHMSVAYLNKGMQARALEIFEPTLEQNFHSASEAFVSYYARNGQRNLALLIADVQFDLAAAPVVEWIRALEEPDADHSAGLARLRHWESQTDSGISLSDLSIVLLAFGAYEEFAASRISGFYTWLPDARDFRATPLFKKMFRENGVLAYWQDRGFPDFCRPLGDDDFECDQLN